MADTLFDTTDELDIIDTEYKSDIKVKEGDLFQLGRHRLLCGDCTVKENIDLLMNGEKADMVFTDPPYGMGKKIQNDNLDNEDFIEFNKKWIDLSLEVLKEMGAWYCWGNDKSILQIYSEILKEYIDGKRLTFKNLITWDKGSAQKQQRNSLTIKYAVADEKCLFVINGFEYINYKINADKYNECFDPIRLYIHNSIKAMNWTLEYAGSILGLTGRAVGHWTSKSQWYMIPEHHYNKLKEKAKEEMEIKGEYSGAFNREYEEIMEEYEKSEIVKNRAYFNNIHDNFNNVWRFNRTSNKVKYIDCGEHPTPKPVDLCMRAIKSSSLENEIILDFFLGSGSTLIASEKTNRICYGMEIEPYYCSVIIKRFQRYTGKKAVKLN